MTKGGLRFSKPNLHCRVLNAMQHSSPLLCLLLCLSIVIHTQATWFPAMEISKWDDVYQQYDILNSYNQCSDVYSGRPTGNFVSLYRKTPATIVITGSGEGLVDVKYQDTVFTFDQKVID